MDEMKRIINSENKALIPYVYLIFSVFGVGLMQWILYTDAYQCDYQSISSRFRETLPLATPLLIVFLISFYLLITVIKLRLLSDRIGRTIFLIGVVITAITLFYLLSFIFGDPLTCQSVK